MQPVPAGPSKTGISSPAPALSRLTNFLVSRHSLPHLRTTGKLLQCCHSILLVLLLPLSVAQLGCRQVPKPSIVEDRLPYNQAIAESWKEQTLLNIVKLRYADPPFFVDVPQITSGYTYQKQTGMSGGIFPAVSNLNTFGQQLGVSLNHQNIYQDRPTISYTPQTGAQFVRNLTNPINPASILMLLQSGYPADVIFDLAVDSVNGIRNRTVLGGQIRQADPEFSRIVETLRLAQANSHIGIRIQHEQGQSDSVVMFIQDKGASAELIARLSEVRSLLGLDPNAQEFRVVFSAATSSKTEIAMISRSAYRILLELASHVEVPPEHLATGIASPLEEPLSGETQPFQVLSGCDKPPAAFVSVCYEGHWFWIEKSDFHSKRTLNYLQIMLALADSGTRENLPVMTIQAN
jgi:hypothetical protein